ncbi:MAE_28990/MAE_18760 family HEPN-like nuclease [Streptosporangium sp. NBC_01756]|uniref:MAE_28990/MAE_18760 family HEPN-like nuclease n=1 Tax=Streptosporangium sp. NBC_01756 TaxID=2975950 RepID=UPI002DDC161F|nr:MAE_28990/MAE_18760 family HEPN-like nuclease [Streptosporangium sp. NBC_01756]WSC83083.1 MAE_28990/MAE_18760 family HEPN-like nuclease [Streptosporangium sp. NBC_01756]
MDPEKFTERLHKGLSQRKFELAKLRFMIDADRGNGDRLNCVNRSAIVLSYAHWEGFVKEASIKYIKYINGCALKASSLRLPLQAACISSHFKRALSSDKPRYLAEILDAMDSRRQETFSIDPNKIVKTESNLSSVVFHDLVLGLGLDFLDIYETRRAFIDAKLLDARNQVAHGELVSFDAGEVIERIDGVISLIDHFSNQLIDGVSNNVFLLDG